MLKVDKMHLSEEQDRRVKLTKDDKENIRKMYQSGYFSLNDLAREFNVSKKLILITVNPESKRKSDQRIKDHWKDYYDKERHRIAVGETRKYKKELYEKGELK